MRTYCKDCIFWDCLQGGSATRAPEGRCRRHAPFPATENMEVEPATVWPLTFDDDWCGEGRTPGGAPEEQTERLREAEAILAAPRPKLKKSNKKNPKPDKKSPKPVIP